MAQPVDPMKVAIAHDWLVGGGAERVVLELHRMFPDAPIYTSYCSKEWRQKLDGKVVTGYLQHWPFSKLRKFLPVLRIWWFTHLKFDDYDLVISSSGAEAKGVKMSEGTKHINYCHAPTHYYWNRYDEYLQQPGFGVLDPLARFGLKLLVGPLRRWDYKAAQRPDVMIANSTFTQRGIKKYYGRDSVVIHPPVDIERFQIPNSKFQIPPRRGFVVTGRQVPYKHIDLAVGACSALDLPLKVIGNGPAHMVLEEIAGSTVTFLTNVSDEELPMHLASAEAFIFPVNADDFGISAIEAMAAGTPVIAYKAGGPLDYIVPGKTGLFFDQQTVESLTKTIKAFDARKFDAKTIQDHAKQFSPETFKQKMADLINKVFAGKN